MKKPNIDILCDRIYARHQKAIDMILSQIPTSQDLIRDIFVSLIEKDENLLLIKTLQNYIGFTTKKLDSVIPALGYDWTFSPHILVFEIQNKSNSLSLHLMIGPGPEEIRQRIFEIAKVSGNPFKGNFGNLNQKFQSIWNESLLTAKDYKENEFEELASIINLKWIKSIKEILLLENEILNQYTKRIM